MGNTASLELCKELYELSLKADPGASWVATDKVWMEFADGNYAVHNDKSQTYLDQSAKIKWLCPAYDLGYLLRKLPAWHFPKLMLCIKWNQETFMWDAGYQSVAGKFEQAYLVHADTPEDAVCKLCIELFKQGILTKEPV